MKVGVEATMRVLAFLGDKVCQYIGTVTKELMNVDGALQ